MHISEPRILHKDNQILYRVGVESAAGTGTLWYSVPESFGDLLANSGDASLVALLIPAMARGEDIHINSSVSERLLYNVSGPLQSVLQRMIPPLRQVNIYPDDVCGQATPGQGVATGFSGGIDSYCVLADHHYAESPEGFKVTHLLFNNVGSHRSGGARLFRERYERLLPAAEQLGLPLVMIDSNLDSFYGKGLRFLQTHTLRNASVALLLEGGIGRFMYASAYPYADVFVGPTSRIAYSDAITVPLVSTESLDALSVGSEYTRVEKTLRVAEIPDSYRMLDVCVEASNASGYTNCSTCWKCLRTLATLDVAGYLRRYASAFDLDAYANLRTKYLATVIGSKDPLLREIRQLAKERNYSFPISSRVIHVSGIDPIASLSKRVMRRVKRMVTRFT